MNVRHAGRCLIVGGTSALILPATCILITISLFGTSGLFSVPGVILFTGIPGAICGGCRIAWFHLEEEQSATDYLLRFLPVLAIALVHVPLGVLALSIPIYYIFDQPAFALDQWIDSIYTLRKGGFEWFLHIAATFLYAPGFFWVMVHANTQATRWGVWEFELPKFLRRDRTPFAKRHERGVRLISFVEAARIASGLGGKKQESFEWAGLKLPIREATQHFLVVGVTGSGKTLTLSALMNQFLPTVKQGSARRALVFDPKNEALNQIMKSGADMKHVTILNPFDARSSAWDLAKDLAEPGHAKEFASMLFPRVSKSDPFWDDAPTNLLEGVILSFCRKHPNNWSLRDILLAISDINDLREVLLWDPDSNHHLFAYFEEKKLLHSILATMIAKASHYRIIAACWHNASTKISLEDWVKGERILVFGHSDDFPSALQEINRSMFKRLAQLLLREPDSETRKSFVFIDELGATGNLELLNNLMLKGRSRGVSVALGFQDISSLYETYGQNVAEAIVGQVGNKTFLKILSPTTAKWAERVFGDQEYVEYLRSMSMGHDYTRSKGEHRQIQPIVRDSEFLSLDVPDKDAGRGVTGYHQVWRVGSFANHMPVKDSKVNATIANFQPRPPDHQRLLRWTEEEREALGLAGETGVQGEEPLDYT